ncbi:unnamed protein product [Adineta ricciae]|uniref:Uncharacterized protein n=1 Tax=Adineta ricciae TaxID=249248 RepID=A0A815JDL6_ADIRI|nr:unnamed protein product [Adineta ricciae]CAF1614950.1 unnamed protein product [Adineta ricciae]
MFKKILNGYPSCLSNQSIVDELTQQCMNIDSYCLNLTSTTTLVSTQSTSSLLTTTIPSTESSLPSTTFSTERSTAQITTMLTLTTKQPSTSSLTTSAMVKDDHKWKIILGIMIPLTIIIIGLFVAVICIVKRRKVNKSSERIELQE